MIKSKWTRTQMQAPKRYYIFNLYNQCQSEIMTLSTMIHNYIVEMITIKYSLLSYFFAIGKLTLFATSWKFAANIISSFSSFVGFVGSFKFVQPVILKTLLHYSMKNS